MLVSGRVDVPAGCAVGPTAVTGRPQERGFQAPGYRQGALPGAHTTAAARAPALS